MTFGQLAKYTSAMYAELPPAEKESWVARAESDKARYLHELASYIPPPGYDPKGDAIVNAVATKGGRKGKPEKDVNAPKRNMSAYLLYQNALRDQFKRENPGTCRRMLLQQAMGATTHITIHFVPSRNDVWSTFEIHKSHVQKPNTGRKGNLGSSCPTRQGSVRSRAGSLRSSTWAQCQGRTDRTAATSETQQA